MTRFWHRAKPLVWGAFCVLLALYFSPLSITVGYALATHGKIPLLSLLFKPGLTFVVMILGMPVIFGAFCFLVGAAIESYRENEVKPQLWYAVLFCAFYAVGWVNPGIGKGWLVRRAGLQRAATRARPLVSAIEKFRAEHKRVPHKLEELVPNYLSEIPQTGMAAYPRFHYSTSNEHTYFQTYQLQIRTPAGGINWVTFNYWPEGDYRPEMYGGSVERIGDWAYVHE